MENQWKTMSDEEYLKMLPVGFTFQPKDEELIVHYLMKKLKNEPLPPNKIYSVNLYDFSPDRLVDMLGEYENEWYMFSPIKRSSGGKTVVRTTPDGFWKSTSGDKIIKHNGEKVGYHKTFVYYKGKSKKTNWIMQEYRLMDHKDSSTQQKVLDNFVLCKIYKNRKNYVATRNHEVSKADDRESPNPVAIVSSQNVLESPEETIGGNYVDWDDAMINDLWNEAGDDNMLESQEEPIRSTYVDWDDDMINDLWNKPDDRENSNPVAIISSENVFQNQEEFIQSTCVDWDNAMIKNKADDQVKWP
ncbi:hypothetical protein DH2020_014215 [Rehmannia glutinosa]|uniref:NAC domain-containing protein n=1 Tax=Rehmannia glutinosa TaxID=99300 RepID=A0ABR0WWI3_REHGL